MTSVPFRWRLAVILFASLLGKAASVTAQESGAEHATLRTWEEDLWLSLLDRTDSFGGRFSTAGILHRFNRFVDHKYQLDLFSSRASPLDSYRWYELDNGLRWRAASVTKVELVSLAEFKSEIRLAEAWSMGVRFDEVHTLLSKGSALRLRFSRRLGGATVSVGSHFDPERKTGSDLWLGARWSAGPARLRVQLVVLDFLNNAVFETLDAAVQPQIDSTVVYERQPIALRTGGDVALSDRVRVEVYATVVLPSRAVVFEEQDRASGFTLDESLWYAGTLLEWSPTERLLLAGFATTVIARSERSPNSSASPDQAYELVERTTEAGAFFEFRPEGHWSIGGTHLRKWLPERRTVREDASANVDYLYRTWLTSLDLTHTSDGGFTTLFSLFHNVSHVPRGQGQVPTTEPLEAEHYRFLSSFGVRLDHVVMDMGAAADYTLRIRGWKFGGVRFRLTAFW